MNEMVFVHASYYNVFNFENLVSFDKLLPAEKDLEKFVEKITGPFFLCAGWFLVDIMFTDSLQKTIGCRYKCEENDAINCKNDTLKCFFSPYYPAAGWLSNITTGLPGSACDSDRYNNDGLC
ncbi:uncharacterized protein CELE_Y53G8AM.6 [Caenorhabditis elegans]|uniref:Uncharacterized protein n=1 Tax=Caenorhabditis elegans TaxID=6239 RepID=Q9N3G9_CAEEL|nr:Uncharacterized protein CELE_Y53G8AM.6 [Caenorhabditis elegans]CCD73805.2 Uncharacterized protein CELE_Y53G8AM.6 [Caenorhabditis elegans]